MHANYEDPMELDALCTVFSSVGVRKNRLKSAFLFEPGQCVKIIPEKGEQWVLVSTFLTWCSFSDDYGGAIPAEGLDHGGNESMPQVRLHKTGRCPGGPLPDLPAGE